MKTLIKQWARKIGVDVRGYSEHNNLYLRLNRYIRDLELGLLLDVGANRGQFGEAMFEAGYGDALWSFEPLEAVHPTLRAAAAKRGGLWRIAEPVALSDRAGEVELKISSSSASSSLFEHSDDLVEMVSGARAVDAAQVRAARLDEEIGALDVSDGPFALKIDTQGSELAVLAGAEGVMERVRLIALETSIRALYKGQPRYFEVDAYLRERGYRLIDIEQGFRDPGGLELQEYDAVYVRDM